MEETLGTRLARLRAEAGLKQKDLADAAGVTPSAVSQIESGTTTDISARVALAFARRLGITVEELLEPSLAIAAHQSAHEGRAPYIAPRASAQASYLAQWWDELDREQQQRLVGMFLAFGPAVSNDRVSKFLKPAPSDNSMKKDKQ
jgi:transcriptional regulator with XRE-family HTH domain